MRVLILHNAVAADADAAERDVLVQAEAVGAALAALGHQPECLAATLDLDSLRRQLIERKPDLVFNLVEALAGSDWLLPLPAALLDALGLPYTGGRTEALMESTHKVLAKRRLRAAGLPTPDWLEARRTGAGSQFVPGRRWIVKAVFEHASFGLDDQSVVTAADEASLRAQVQSEYRRHGKPFFAEQYIDGREFNLSVLAGPTGPRVLPAAEIVFVDFPADKARVVGQQAKWDEDTVEYQNTVRRFGNDPADAALVAELQRLALACWELFDLRGFVRVDFRVDPAGRPYILEVNVNPCLSPDAGFAAAVAEAGLRYEEAIASILEDSLRP